MKTKSIARAARPKEKTGVKGMFRVHILEDGELVGDSGWQKNQISNLGYLSFLCQALASSAGSSQIGFMALGTGTIVAAAGTNLDGEVSKRAAVTAASSNTSKTIRFTATFDSSNSFVTATKNIDNIGLFMSSSAGTIFSGNTFASSSCATNQIVNATYDIIFS
jgi:hypothetical protein